MTNEDKCPLCLNAEGGLCKWVSHWNHRDVSRFECDICGTYQLTREAYKDYMNRELTSYQRAVLSHKVRTTSSNGDKETPTLTRELLWPWISDGTLPSPAMQAENLIRFVGSEVLRSGKNVDIFPPYIYAIMGSVSNQSAISLAEELQERKLLRMNPQGGGITLSLDGWERYEAEKRGRFSGHYGFIAMKFNDPGLDSFVKDVVQPVVKEEIGYDLVDMRNVSQTGSIDNIMLVRIRDSAFVIADLTHDNHGAYWEAGYAEGLGKPVVYICEKTKFDEKGTHFDVSHYMTILWSNDDPKDDSKEFRKKLVATLQHSLNLPSTGT